MVTHIPCEEVSADYVMPAPPVDGLYAVITYSYRRVGLYRLRNPFPWHITINKFEGGSCDEMGCGSSPGDALSKYEVAKVLLIALDQDKRAELEKNLLEHDIVLV